MENKDCTVCKVTSEPKYLVVLLCRDEHLKCYYTFSSRDQLVEFLMNVNYLRYDALRVLGIDGHDFTVPWD